MSPNTELLNKNDRRIKGKTSVQQRIFHWLIQDTFC